VTEPRSQTEKLKQAARKLECGGDGERTRNRMSQLVSRALIDEKDPPLMER
jgi:hypothetical protein